MHAHTKTHYRLVHRKFCIKHILAGCPGQGVPNMPAAVWLCHWYKTRLLCVCTSAVRQHTTPCASVRKWNSCNPNQISSSQPQRALKLLKVPDLHLHLLSFQDRIKSYSHLQGRREGGEFTSREEQQPHPCTHLCGCVTLQGRWRLDNPGSLLPVLSFSQMKFSDRLLAPWAFAKAREQIYGRLGCICVLPINMVPFGSGGAVCSRQSL